MVTLKMCGEGFEIEENKRKKEEKIETTINVKPNISLSRMSPSKEGDIMRIKTLLRKLEFNYQMTLHVSSK